MSIDLAALKSELQSDPQGLGYAAPLAAGTPVVVASLINATTGPGAATVTLASIDTPSLLVALRPALMSLPNLSATLQQKWDRVLSWIRSVESTAIDATSVALFQAAVSDGVLTAQQASACYQRIGSRAEVLFGAGSVVQWQDVAAAMNS